MINVDDLEDTNGFKTTLRKPYFSETVPWVIDQFGMQSFTRSHIVAYLLENNVHPHSHNVDESVRQEIIDLFNNGKIQKTGNKKFGRIEYRKLGDSPIFEGKPRNLPA